MNGFVVLFGSAATGAANPRDLDTVVGGCYSEADATAAAQAWWLVEYGGTRSADDDLASQLRDTPPPPVEVTRHQGDGPVYLLRPRGAETTVAVTLRGEVEVRWSDVDSLPAAIRLATDGQPELAARMVKRLRVKAPAGDTWNGRIPLSLAPYDKARPVGIGGYEGDGPVALEQALARTGDRDLDALLRATPADRPLIDLLETIRATPGAWSGRRWRKGEEPGLMAGLRQQWISGTPLGCRGYAGATDVLFEYAPKLSLWLVREIVKAVAS